MSTNPTIIVVKIKQHRTSSDDDAFIFDITESFDSILDRASQFCAPHQVLGLNLQPSESFKPSGSLSWFTSGAIVQASVWDMLVAAAQSEPLGRPLTFSAIVKLGESPESRVVDKVATFEVASPTPGKARKSGFY